MKNLNRQMLFTCVALLLALNLLLGGCGNAKKPLEQAPGNTAAPNITSPDQSYPADVANRASVEAEKVPGVKKAMAVVSDKTIYIALDLNPNSGQAAASAIEGRVSNQVKSIVPGYGVWATSEVEAASTIQNIAQGISQGQPVSNFSSELQRVEERIRPRF